MQGNLYFFYMADRKMEMCFLVQGQEKRNAFSCPRTHSKTCRALEPLLSSPKSFLYPTVSFSLLAVSIKTAFTVNKLQVAKMNVFIESII